MKRFDVAVVGATGAVGGEMVRILESRHFPVGRLYPLASSRSAGKCVDFRGESMAVEDLAAFDFSKVRLALFSAVGRRAPSTRQGRRRRGVWWSIILRSFVMRRMCLWWCRR